MYNDEPIPAVEESGNWDEEAAPAAAAAVPAVIGAVIQQMIQADNERGLHPDRRIMGRSQDR
ncbi:40S ribosomal protein sa [Culex quinquefasciatus]|uniref:40S ribosomal protein sa n=1 Tax=Culex quinquefasciatus TaxID=7176 RepID=B0WNU6_CULQU|nr:40S ribosomal protein sa [Culex quinquefasciatus]|eukprot:XP_001850380.1 40S ribosomal protein sa [Culex quinquefasciatus]